MELQNVVLGDGDGIEVFVDKVQRISITCDFLFIPISGRRFFLHKLPDTAFSRAPGPRARRISKAGSVPGETSSIKKKTHAI